MKINFILSSLNDSHFLKRVQEFIDHGYDVKVFGFRRKGLPSPNVLFPMQELGEIACGNYLGRLVLFRRTIKQIAEKRLEGLFFIVVLILLYLQQGILNLLIFMRFVI